MSRPSPFGADKPRSASGHRPSPADPASARADGARLNRRLYRGRTAPSVSSRADGPRRFAGLRPSGRVPLTLCENPLSALSGVLPDREDAVAAMLYLLAVRAGADPETRVYVFPGGALGLEGNGAILCGDAPRSAVREWAGWLGFDRVLRGADGVLSVQAVFPVPARPWIGPVQAVQRAQSAEAQHFFLEGFVQRQPFSLPADALKAVQPLVQLSRFFPGRQAGAQIVRPFFGRKLRVLKGKHKKPSYFSISAASGPR